MYMKLWRLKSKLFTGGLILAVFVLFFLLVTKESSDGMRNLSLLKNNDGDVLAKERNSLDESVKRMQADFAKMQQELAMEKMKGEMIQREVKQQQMENKVAELRKALSLYNTSRANLKMEFAQPNQVDIKMDVVKSNVTERPVAVTDEQKFEERQAARRRVIADVCGGQTGGGKHPQGMINYLITGREGLTYCVIPKTGRTFWYQVFRYTNRDNMGHDEATGPLDIDPKDAVKKSFLRTKSHMWSRLKDKEKSNLLDSKIFLTVQHPYLRLWMTYVNGLMLPGKWNSVGAKIEKANKRKRFMDKNGVLKVGKMCGMSTSFSDFVEWALDKFEVEYYPYYKQCDPCQLIPTYIIKEETSLADTEFVLKHFGLDWVVKPDANKGPTGPRNFTDVVNVRKLRQVVTDAFNLLKQSLAAGCGTPKELGERIWTALEAYGFVPEGMSHQEVDFTKSADVVIGKALQLYQIMQQKHTDRLSARMSIMKKNMKLLSPELLGRVQEKYRHDFHLFSYNMDLETLWTLS